MSDVAIRVENLSKQFHIGSQVASYRTFRETIQDAVSAPFRRAASLLRGQATGASELNESFWALRNLSFEVKEGEVIGIIGRNGAGKSTLLKILSRITEPTEGRITLRGRVGSLLEVGTGFHPELTGRENVYLNGAILGMRRVEIERKFDEIIAFAEIERFVDTPVKHYSSGMYMRLAFAVAAFLEPEILIVDEVLAVGDAAFQKKCLGKMGEVAGEGRTVLFVSHNMGAMNELCTKAIWLKSGQIQETGTTAQVVSHYLRDGATTASGVVFADHPAADQIKFLSLELLTVEGIPTYTFDVTKPIVARFGYEIEKKTEGLELSFRVRNALGIIVFTANRSPYLGQTEPGRYSVEIEIPALTLVPDDYVVDLYAHVPFKATLIVAESLLRFEVMETGSPMHIYRNNDYGVVFANVSWRERTLEAL